MLLLGLIISPTSVVAHIDERGKFDISQFSNTVFTIPIINTLLVVIMPLPSFFALIIITPVYREKKKVT
jgi:hypothetical protein